MLAAKEEVQENWGKIEEYLKFNDTYLIFHRWFLREFLQKRVVIGENELNALIKRNEYLSVKSFQEIDELEIEKKAFSIDTFIVHVSMNKESIGKITASSRSVKKFTGYEAKEIEGKNINVLMPKSIRSLHQNILEDYVVNCQRETNNQISSFIKKKDNFITPVRVVLKLVIHFGNIEFVGMIRHVVSRTQRCEYLLIDSSRVRAG